MQDYERSVLEKYDIDIHSTRKIRGAVLCDAGQEMYLLKESSMSAERVESLAELYECLENQSWCNVDRIIKNQEDTYITSAENGNKYILKQWFSGRECDLRKPGELIDAAGMLAKLHMVMQYEPKNPVAAAESLETEYLKHNRELKKVRSYIRKSVSKNNFEFAFLKSFDQMYVWAESALELLTGSAYKKLYQESIEKSYFVHGEYNYHNIMMNNAEPKSNIVAVTNFEKYKKDIQVEDFYYFLRKVMEKYGWKERLGDSLLNAYSAVKPLTEDEMEYLQLRLVYPEKFWKIANSYYHSSKAWISAKSIEKLEVSLCQTKEKERFLKNVFSYELQS